MRDFPYTTIWVCKDCEAKLPAMPERKVCPDCGGPCKSKIAAK
jgi:rRNA maturation endonuclease Nob1